MDLKETVLYFYKAESCNNEAVKCEFVYTVFFYTVHFFTSWIYLWLDLRGIP